MISTIVALLGGWRSAAFASLALLSLTWGISEHYRVNSAHAALATLQAQVAEAEANAQTIARSESERRDTAASSATQSMLDYLSANLPSIETRTHDTIERIRTVYRDHPAAGLCERPDGVQRDLDAARARANASPARGLPALGAGAGAADPAARAGDGRVGARRDGDRRVGASGVERGAGLPRAAAVGAGHPVAAR